MSTTINPYIPDPPSTPQPDSDLGLDYSDFGVKKPTEPDIRQQLAGALCDAASNAYYSVNSADEYDEFLATPEDYYEEAGRLIALISQTVNSVIGESEQISMSDAADNMLGMADEWAAREHLRDEQRERAKRLLGRETSE